MTPAVNKPRVIRPPSRAGAAGSNSGGPAQLSQPFIIANLLRPFANVDTTFGTLVWMRI
jgi:hypothetical protein